MINLSIKDLVAEKSYQMLQFWSFCNRERVKPLSIKITALTFLAKKSKLELSGMSFLRKREKKIEFKSSSRSRPRIQILRSLSWLSTRCSDENKNCWTVEVVSTCPVYYAKGTGQVCYLGFVQVMENLEVMKFTNFIFQAWKVMEFNCQSWKVISYCGCQSKNNNVGWRRVIKQSEWHAFW